MNKLFGELIEKLNEGSKPEKKRQKMSEDSNLLVCMQEYAKYIIYIEILDPQRGTGIYPCIPPGPTFRTISC